MWCDVKKCNHNRNGYCQNKDYISIDAEGKCDSNTVIEYNPVPEKILFVNEEKQEKAVKSKPKAISLGFNPHDGEARYKCPVCETPFGSWDIFHNEPNVNGIKAYCPHCKTELRGVK